MDFIVRKFLAEFVPVDRLEVIDSLAAQLLRCFHAYYFTPTSMVAKGGSPATSGTLLVQALGVREIDKRDEYDSIILNTTVFRTHLPYLAIAPSFGSLWDQLSCILNSQFVFVISQHGFFSTPKLFAGTSKTSCAFPRRGCISFGRGERGVSLPP